MKFEELLTQHKIPFMKTGQHHHARHGWIQLDCLMCSPRENAFRLGYNLKGSYFNCWSCGPKSTAKTISDLLKIPLSHAKQLTKGIKKDYTIKESVTGILEMPTGIGELQTIHKQYLRKRKYDWEQIVKLWNISATANLSGRLNWRIVIPIMKDGKTVSWTSRSVVDDGVRYITAKPTQETIFHKNLLYGEDYCRTDSIIIHEGPFDVWRTGPGSVCTFGTNFNTAQVKKMVEYEVRCVCYDSTKEGQSAANKLVDRLSSFPGDTYNVVLDTKDMSDGNEKNRDLLRQRFLWPLCGD